MRFHNSNNRSAALCLLLCGMGALIAGCSGPHPVASPTPKTSAFKTANLPPGVQSDLVRRGKLIFDQTPKYARAYVGNRLACSDCHLKSGTTAYSAPMIDVANIFPRFNKRAGRVISIQERFQQCFTRSENGRPLPSDSPEMKALTAYVNWLSRNGVKGKAYKGRGFGKLLDLTGNPAKGKSIYASQCAACHGAHGSGVPPVLPPVWGPDSYNDGAGMNNPRKMAGFLIHNMPQNHPGTLTPQQAFDVAYFIHAMPRPKFNPAYKGY
ncbi:MAG: c-type cytochrome [Acidobacteriaceae bacterium]